MMQNATKDLLRLVLTASAVVGFLLYANFEAASVVPPRSDALARSDAPRKVKSISEARIENRATPEVLAPADALAARSGKFGPLLALVQ